MIRGGGFALLLACSGPNGPAGAHNGSGLTDPPVPSSAGDPAGALTSMPAEAAMPRWDALRMETAADRAAGAAGGSAAGAEPLPAAPGAAQGPMGGPTGGEPMAGPGAMDGTDGVASDTGGGMASAAALEQLRAHLAIDRGARPAIGGQSFAAVPLSRTDAGVARDLLWEDLAAHIRATRAAEHEGRSITIDGYTLRYETVALGDEPPGGRDLFISMHGGGSAPAPTNDSQWRNQVSLGARYDPMDALWVAPRAPTDDWNMWFKDHVDDLFDRLISNMVVFEGIDPNRVYLTGYSAGGDGVYGLSPRTADRWAGAAMSAGHPNGVSVANLRNVAFALHAGGNDTAFERNTVTQEYIDKLSMLQAVDSEGYPFQGMVHPGLPHWMNLADAVSIPFMQGHTRSAHPDRVVWEQHERTHTRMYWLAVEVGQERPGTRLVASYQGQTITVEEAEGLSGLLIRMSDEMLDLDQPVAVVQAGATVFEGVVPRTVAVLAATLDDRQEPSMVYAAELLIDLSRD